MKKLCCIAFILIACGGTRLTTLDTRRLLEDEKACRFILKRAQDVKDGGAIESLGEACYCDSRAILIDAHKIDASVKPVIECP